MRQVAMLRWRGLCWITCIFLVSCGIPEHADGVLARPATTGRPSPAPTPAAPALPLDVLSGDLCWTPAQSPIILQHDQRLLPGATLMIEPDTEVELAPGVAFFVEGTLSALDIAYGSGGRVILIGNRIGGNRMVGMMPPVQITSQSARAVVSVEIQGNLLIGQGGPDLVLITNGPLVGALSCNAWLNGRDGLSVRGAADTFAATGLLVRDNAFEDHTPPRAIYLRKGIGRGATSVLALDLRNNWWNSPLGPYHPEQNPVGAGDAVGVNVAFAPWLTARPPCAPRP